MTLQTTPDKSMCSTKVSHYILLHLVGRTAPGEIQGKGKYFTFSVHQDLPQANGYHPTRCSTTGQCNPPDHAKGHNMTTTLGAFSFC